MKLGFSAAIAGCALALFSATAAPAKPQKPAAAKTATKDSPKPQRRLPGVSQEAPLGVRVQPPPVAAKPAAKPAVKAKPKAVAAKAPAAKGKKRQAAKPKETVKSGRAALAVAGVDANQLAVDHLKGAGSKSPIELLASYKETVRDGDLETSAVLLRLVTGETPDREAVTEVNDLLGVTLDTQDTEALIDIAKGKRAVAVVENVGEGQGESDTDANAASRIAAAHAAASSAPRRAVKALANYKRAVSEQNREAAVLALAAAAGQPADEALMARANALLGLEGAFDGRLAEHRGLPAAR